MPGTSPGMTMRGSDLVGENRREPMQAETAWCTSVTALAARQAPTQASRSTPGVALRLLDTGIDLTSSIRDFGADRVGEARRGIHIHDDGAMAFKADL